MKYIFISFLLLMSTLNSQCQSEKEIANSISRLGRISNPIIYLDGAILDSMEYSNLDLKIIKSLIIEGDSNWLKYHINKGDTSIMAQYFDQGFKRGLMLLFRKDQLVLKNRNEIRRYLKKREGLTLWKINSKPFTNDFKKVEQISLRKIIKFEIFPSIQLKNLHTQKIENISIVLVDTKNYNPD